ncbi:ricin B lectin domain-containing protein [Mycena leptocephala]|nr:ricin B lectin domain-containing protein [Mycena leptocephala]
MLSSSFVALSALILSASAVQIQSTNAAFFNAGIQGCISGENEEGAPVVIHNCNTEDPANQEFGNVSFFTRQNSGPQVLNIFTDKCVGVVGDSTADGAKLELQKCLPRPLTQRWISVTDSTLQLEGTNKCIDLTDGKITDGNQLQIWTCNSNNSNQKWFGEPNPDNSELAHVFGGDFSANGGGPYCLTAASDTDGAEVALVACINSNLTDTFPNGNATWTVPVAPLTGTIKTFHNKCLDVPNGSTANGVKLQIWTCAAGNTNQLFTNTRGQIEWAGKGKCIDLTDGKSVNGNPIQLWDCAVPDNNPNQEWDVSLLLCPATVCN